MLSSFARLFAGFLITLSIFSALVYGILDSWNSLRFKKYLDNLSQPLSYLISQGWQRQPPARRQAWLAVVADLTGLHWQISSDNNRKPYRNWFEQRGQILAPLSGNEQLTVELGDWQQLLAATGLLVLNDLSLLPAERRELRFNELIGLFAIPMRRVSVAELQLDFLSLRQLELGNYTTVSSDLGMSVLVPLGSDSVIVLGPVQRYSWLSPQVLIYLIIAFVSATGILAFGFYWPFHRRVAAMTESVSRIGQTRESIAVPDQGKDDLAVMGRRINEMANHLIDMLNASIELNRGISHDLKTPLARIMFALELLHPSDRQRAVVDGIQRDLHTLMDLVHDLLLNHQLQATAPQLTEAVDWVQLVTATLAQNPVAVQVDFDAPEQLLVYARHSHVQRLTDNLLSNALQHCCHHVQVGLRQYSDHINFIVEDDGPGIDEAEREKVFEAFYRGENSRTGDQHGYGLGLTLCMSLARHYRGHISVTQSHLGGACFCVEMPVTQT